MLAIFSWVRYTKNDIPPKNVLMLLNFFVGLPVAKAVVKIIDEIATINNISFV